MPTISLCMIVKDEEDALARCLDSVDVDEIIIVDTGSTDSTKKIARKYTDKVFDFRWKNDFSDARNFSISKATSDWILVLDADEVIEDMGALRKLTGQGFDAFRLIQRNYTDDMTRPKWVAVEKNRYTKGYSGYERNPVVRLFRNNGMRFTGPVHEIVDTTGMRCKDTQIPIHHYIEEKPLKERQLKYLDIAEKALKTRPTGRLHYTAGSVYFCFLKDYKKAKDNFLSAMQYNDDKIKTMEALAATHIELKEYEEAYQIYRQLLKAGYISPSMSLNLANLLVMHKHYKPALKYLKKAIELGHVKKEMIEKNILAIKSMNVNNAEYWDRIWEEEGAGTWRRYPKTNEEVAKLVGKGRKILELGCGVGLLAELLDKDNTVTGIDISKAAIDIMKKRIDIKGIVAKVPPIPAEDDEYDVIVANEFLEHFIDTDEILSEISRVAKVAILGVPDNILGHERCKEHYQKFTEESLKRLLSRYFDEIEISSFTDRFDLEGKNARIALPVLLAYCRRK